MFPKIRELFLYFANFLVCNLCIGPLVVSYWQGSWRILDHFAYIEDKDVFYWTIFLIGFSVCYINIFTQSCWIDHIATSKNLIFIPVSRCYSYISAFGLVHLWYGVWNLTDLYSGKNFTSALVNIVIVLTLLGSFRTLKNITGPPNVVFMDLDKDNYFRVITRFNTENDVSVKFSADVLVTVILGGAMVPLAWRGTWTLLDVLLFPNDLNLTTLYSFIIYLSIEACMIILHKPSKLLSSYLDKKGFIIIKVLFEDLVACIVFLSCVCCWRGIWLILDTYFIPENKKLAAWTAHLIGFFGLTFFMFSQSILLKGCIVDGSMTEGRGMSYPTKVLHMMIKYCTNAETEKKAMYQIERDHGLQNGDISTIENELPQTWDNDNVVRTPDDNQGAIKNYGSVTESNTSINPSG